MRSFTPIGVSMIGRRMGSGGPATVTPVTAAAEPADPEYSENWYYTNHRNGGAIRCAGPGFLECASVNGRECMWGLSANNNNFRNLNLYDRIRDIDVESVTLLQSHSSTAVVAEESDAAALHTVREPCPG